MSVSTFDAAGASARGGDKRRLRITASSVAFPGSVLMVIGGMVWGLVMAISQDHAMRPAHAHLNLLGWVCLFMFGVFYHLHPETDRSRIALAQVVIWIAATLVMVAGIAIVHAGDARGELLAAIGSLVVLADTILFGWLITRRNKVA